MYSIHMGSRPLLKADLVIETDGDPGFLDLETGHHLKGGTFLASLMTDGDLVALHDARQLVLTVNGVERRELLIWYIFDDIEDHAVVENELGEITDIHEITLEELVNPLKEPEFFPAEP